MLHISNLSVVVIGRNEGERLIRCLQSIRKAADCYIVYVDSGSTDNSLIDAQSLCDKVIQLDSREGFTAARARNAGLRSIEAVRDEIDFVQFIDGDCELNSRWLETALAFIQERPNVASVCGRRRERFPDRNIFHQICDIEWDTPVGEALACGGDALFRYSHLHAVGAYREDLIAGEEPELCLRLRSRGLKIIRLPAEMTLHDANIARFTQWWQRTKRCGHAYAEVSDIARGEGSTFWRREVLRAVTWGFLLPLTMVAGIAFLPSFALIFFLPWMLLLSRYSARSPLSGPAALKHGLLLLLGKTAETLGIARYYLKRLLSQKSRLIEYK